MKKLNWKEFFKRLTIGICIVSSVICAFSAAANSEYPITGFILGALGGGLLGGGIWLSYVIISHIISWLYEGLIKKDD